MGNSRSYVPEPVRHLPSIGEHCFAFDTVVFAVSAGAPGGSIEPADGRARLQLVLFEGVGGSPGKAALVFPKIISPVGNFPLPGREKIRVKVIRGGIGGERC